MLMTAAVTPPPPRAPVLKHPFWLKAGLLRVEAAPRALSWPAPHQGERGESTMHVGRERANQAERGRGGCGGVGHAMARGTCWLGVEQDTHPRPACHRWVRAAALGSVLWSSHHLQKQMDSEISTSKRTMDEAACLHRANNHARAICAQSNESFFCQSRAPL
jgi:hypothetical protein